MFQLGCLRASAAVTFFSSALVLPLNGPPEAVSIILLILLRLFPLRHWKIAECSLSTGYMLTLCSLTAFIISSPADTSVSLFASAISFPALMASNVGTMPMFPTTDVTTVSLVSYTAASIRPSIPLNIFMSHPASLCLSFSASVSSITAAMSGRNSLICFSRKSIFLLAVSALTSIPPISLTTSSVCVPMEPVEPRIVIFSAIFLPPFYITVIR